jgi:hypothetical protein
VLARARRLVRSLEHDTPCACEVVRELWDRDAVLAGGNPGGEDARDRDLGRDVDRGLGLSHRTLDRRLDVDGRGGFEEQRRVSQRGGDRVLEAHRHGCAIGVRELVGPRI